VFFEPEKRDLSVLPHDPFKAIVAPRPIGWISSISAAGEVNLAPYSYFNGVLSRPNCVMFSSEGYKDSAKNVEETGEFVCNFATWELREQMNATSAHVPRNVNEMELAGLQPAPSRIVKPPRVKAAPAALECKLLTVVPLKDLDGSPLPARIIVGQVVGVYIDDRFIKNGMLDTAAMQPIMRAGYLDQYFRAGERFAMTRPA